MLETDTSDLATGAVLNQLEPNDKWHPVACYSKKFSDAELNSYIHDKEMVLIEDCFKEWRHDLIGQRVVVYMAHRNLEYFNTTKILNRRQARWAEILSDFNFVITYRHSDKMVKLRVSYVEQISSLKGGARPRFRTLNQAN